MCGKFKVELNENAGKLEDKFKDMNKWANYPWIICVGIGILKGCNWGLIITSIAILHRGILGQENVYVEPGIFAFHRLLGALIEIVPSKKG